LWRDSGGAQIGACPTQGGVRFEVGGGAAKKKKGKTVLSRTTGDPTTKGGKASGSKTGGRDDMRPTMDVCGENLAYY